MALSRYDFPKEMLKELVSEGYGSCETGYWEIPGNGYGASAYIRFPNSKGKMVNWWFGEYLTNTQSYKLWHPDHTTFVWDEKKRPGTPVGATHISEEYLGDQVVPMAVTFYDPTDIFDQQDLDNGGITCCLVAEIHTPEGDLFGMFLHVVRDTYFGCEMRNRFWVPGADETGIRGVVKHGLEEMGNMAEILPTLYRNAHPEG